jgi:REP element-mobilizing transposase RayT
MVGPIQYFDWEALFSVKRRNLPHFCQEGAVYFVTFRLGDSIPQHRLQFWQWQLEKWREMHSPLYDEAELEQIKELGIRRMERFLDRGHGSCVLRNAKAQDAVEGVLRGRDRVTYRLGDYVVMPNHVHAMIRPMRRVELSDLVGPWRSISAKEINRELGRTGELWQDEPFDHIVRGPASLARFRRYIQNNPAKCPEGYARYGCGALFAE